MFWFYAGMVNDSSNIVAPAVAEKLGIPAGSVLNMGTVAAMIDQGTGKLVSSTAVTKDGKPVDSIAFDNGYNPQQTSTVLGGKKNLEGLDLTDGAFTFSLKGVSADTAQEDMAVPMPESGKDTAQNTDAGIFQFGEIVYTVPGTYVYEISEVNQGQEGYTYDGSVYQVTVTVTDEGGQLRAQTAGLDKVVFNNSYKPAAAVLDGDAAIHGQKTLTGRDMKEGEFAFQLLDKDNNVVSETVNSADGSFRFDALTFEEAGDYYYTMVEKNTELGGITYDTTGYTVKVHVEDKGGHLEASVQYLDRSPRLLSWPSLSDSPAGKPPGPPGNDTLPPALHPGIPRTACIRNLSGYPTVSRASIFWHR